MPLAVVQIRLLEPQPQGFAGHAQILGNLRMRFSARPSQANRLGAKLRRIGLHVFRRFGHGHTS
jgi:hypothetical protein